MRKDSLLPGFAVLKIIFFFLQNDLGVSVSFPVPKQATGARLYYVSTEFQTVSVSKVRTNLKEFSQGTSVKGSPSIIHIHFLTALQGKGCVQRTCTHTHTCTSIKASCLVQTSPVTQVVQPPAGYPTHMLIRLRRLSAVCRRGLSSRTLEGRF